MTHVSDTRIKWLDETDNTGEEEKKGRKWRSVNGLVQWDVSSQLNRISDSLSQKKKSGAEIVGRSWTGFKTQVRRSGVVRSLSRRKEQEEGGKIFLKTPDGRNMKFYTFRKSSSGTI